MSAPPPEATGVAAATDELAVLGIRVVPEHCSGRVWPAALTLFQHLVGHDDALTCGARVLELGAGTGWLTLKARQHRDDLQWCATETNCGDAYARLARNLTRAGGEGTMARGSEQDESPETKTQFPRFAALDWSAVADSKIATQAWDLVCGSDLVYGEAGALALAKCLGVLLRKNTDDGDAERQKKGTLPKENEITVDSSPKCLLAQTCGRWGGFGYDAILYDALVSEGLLADAVGGELLLGSRELKQHVVVFKISVARGAAASADAKSHPLLRAKRLRAAHENAAERNMTEEDCDAREASKAMDELDKLLE